MTKCGPQIPLNDARYDKRDIVWRVLLQAELGNPFLLLNEDGFLVGELTQGPSHQH